jgi:hypothetical protein
LSSCKILVKLNDCCIGVVEIEEVVAFRSCGLERAD